MSSRRLSSTSPDLHCTPDSDVVSTWSSGTGFSGVLGSFSYAALINAGLTPRTTLFVMLICPAIMALT